MSTAPQPAPPWADNQKIFALGGLAVGVVILCSGLMGMVLVSSYALERGHAIAANYASPTAPAARKVDPVPPKDDGDETDPFKVARRFLNFLKVGRYEDAYRLTSERLHGEEDQNDFRDRVKKLAAFRNHTNLSLQRPTSGSFQGKATLHGYVDGPGGSSRFTLEMVQDEEGAWRVDSFGN